MLGGEKKPSYMGLEAAVWHLAGVCLSPLFLMFCVSHYLQGGCAVCIVCGLSAPLLPKQLDRPPSHCLCGGPPSQISAAALLRGSAPVGLVLYLQVFLSMTLCESVCVSEVFEDQCAAGTIYSNYCTCTSDVAKTRIFKGPRGGGFA